ncbi:MAG TPA: JAB domain-containing protein [Candidatus Latescibacteria bacterium]|nr:JAB domain-containing protein [Candidatus Latescibacterota bacterium]
MGSVKYPTIKDMPKVEKPREKLMEKGPEALREQELLAILLGSGYRGKNVLEVARRILSEYSVRELSEVPFEKLRRLRGIGPAKACVIKAAFELSKRAFGVEEDLLPVIRTPNDVADAVTNIRRNRKENFVVLYLNARNQVIYKETVSIGTLNASLVHPREVFGPAVANSAASVILAHNHPSGDINPSEDDIELTRRIVKAGELMGIDVLDHVIVSHKGHLSMKDRGII